MNPLSGSRTPDYALILAAGQSRRMGRPKAFLPWLDEKPLVAWMTEKLTAAGWQPRAVLGPALFEQGKATSRLRSG